MKIGIVGAGGVGGLIAGLLLASGQKVYLSARGPHAEAIQKDGLKIESRGRTYHERPTKLITNDLSEFLNCEIILLTVKVYDLEQTCEELKKFVNPKAIFITVQNGIEAPSIVARYFGEENSVGGTIVTSSRIEQPGLIIHEGINLKLILENKNSTVRQFADELNKAGIDTSLSDDITATLWKKMIRLASLSGATCLTRQPYGWVRENPEADKFLFSLISEAYAVAIALGVNLPISTVADSYEGLISHSIYNFKPSMLLDLERNKKIEVRYLSGAISRLGKEHNIPTPCSDAVAVALEPYENGLQDATQDSDGLQ